MTNPKNTEIQGQKSKGKWLSGFNKFKYGFYTGLVLSVLVMFGFGHLLLNVFKVGSISIGGRSLGKIGSPETVTETVGAQADNESNIEQNQAEIIESEDVNQATGDGVIQEDSNNNNQESNDPLSDSSISGETVSVTINYNSNSELPGFDSNKGYSQDPPDISQFSDAILITNVSLGKQRVEFDTREVFINRKKYNSTFSLRPDEILPTRVGFALEVPGKRTDGVFLQFGLADLGSGSTTLTYLVSIFGDGRILWSNQIKYEESQIASVVLDVRDVEDIVIEYQIVETAGIRLSYLDRYPLFFTEAKVLEN